MRLTTSEREVLKRAAKHCFSGEAVIKLFGSRLHDQKRGGDIDLLIQTSISNPSEIARSHIQFLSEVRRELGEQKIDVLIDYPKRTANEAIFTIAQREGILL